jgi:hypothetical protein
MLLALGLILRSRDARPFFLMLLAGGCRGGRCVLFDSGMALHAPRGAWEWLAGRLLAACAIEGCRCLRVLCCIRCVLGSFIRCLCGGWERLAAHKTQCTQERLGGLVAWSDYTLCGSLLPSATAEMQMSRMSKPHHSLRCPLVACGTHHNPICRLLPKQNTMSSHCSAFFCPPVTCTVFLCLLLRRRCCTSKPVLRCCNAFDSKVLHKARTLPGTNPWRFRNMPPAGRALLGSSMMHFDS